jgi:hypothetical protein
MKKLIAFTDFSIAGPSQIPTTSQASHVPTPNFDVTELPLFEPDSSSQIAGDQPSAERRSPSPPPALSVGDQPIVEQGSPSPPLQSSPPHVDDQESQAMNEMREQFRWLVKMLNENKTQGWGTAYRDFVDVSLLLSAAGELGMVEGANHRVCKGVFRASTGNYSLTLATFIEVMGLGYASGTWGNKLTMFFRLKAIYSYYEHAGEPCFQSPIHQDAWIIVSSWLKNQDKLLPKNWVTTKFGNTELRKLARDMLREVTKSKFSTRFSICSVLSLKRFLQGDIEYAEETDR